MTRESNAECERFGIAPPRKRRARLCSRSVWRNGKRAAFRARYPHRMCRFDSDHGHRSTVRAQCSADESIGVRTMPRAERLAALKVIITNTVLPLCFGGGMEYAPRSGRGTERYAGSTPVRSTSADVESVAKRAIPISRLRLGTIDVARSCVYGGTAYAVGLNPTAERLTGSNPVRRTSAASIRSASRSRQFVAAHCRSVERKCIIRARLVMMQRCCAILLLWRNGIRASLRG